MVVAKETVVIENMTTPTKHTHYCIPSSCHPIAELAFQPPVTSTLVDGAHSKEKHTHTPHNDPTLPSLLPPYQQLSSTDSEEAVLECLELFLNGVHEEIAHEAVDVILPVVPSNVRG